MLAQSVPLSPQHWERSVDRALISHLQIKFVHSFTPGENNKRVQHLAERHFSFSQQQKKDTFKIFCGGYVMGI